jgi:hypothetical protein
MDELFLAYIQKEFDHFITHSGIVGDFIEDHDVHTISAIKLMNKKFKIIEVENDGK